MKIFLTSLLIPFLLSGSFQGCQKETLASDNEFQVRVVASFCAYTILEIQDPEYSELGMDWKQFKNVFTVANPCDLPEGMQVDMSYKCRVIEKPIIGNCIQCTGFMETPPLVMDVVLSQ